MRVEENIKGVVPRYLHVGEGAGQGASTRPPLLLQSSAQHLKLPLLLPHRGQQGGRTRTLLHSHAESRAQDSTGQDRVNTRDQRWFNQHREFIKGQTHKARITQVDRYKVRGALALSTFRSRNMKVLMKLIFRGHETAGARSRKAVPRR